MEITVTTDAGEVSVPLDAVRNALPEGTGFYGGDFGDPEGYERADSFKQKLDKRVTSILKNEGYVKPEDAYSDDALKKVLRSKGIELGDDMKPVVKLDPETLNRYKSDWAKDELEPIRTEAETLRQQNTSLRRENVASRTQSKLLDELKADAFKPALPGTPSTFDALMAHFVQFDDDGKAYFQAGSDAMPEYDIPKAVLGYVAKNNKDLLADKRQAGGTPGQGGGGGDSDPLNMTPEQRAKHLREKRTRMFG